MNSMNERTSFCAAAADAALVAFHSHHAVASGPTLPPPPDELTANETRQMRQRSRLSNYTMRVQRSPLRPDWTCSQVGSGVSGYFSGHGADLFNLYVV
jgi:hypothetical protein